MNYKIIIIVCLALIGLFLLEVGITGFVVSESCCYGEGCNPENLCSVFKEQPKSFDNDIKIALIGLVVLVCAVIWFYKHKEE